MAPYGPLDGYLEKNAFSSTGSVMDLAEIARLLSNIEKKLYVLIKKQEESIGVLRAQDNGTTYAEDMGYQQDNIPKELDDK